MAVEKTENLVKLFKIADPSNKNWMKRAMCAHTRNWIGTITEDSPNKREMYRGSLQGLDVCCMAAYYGVEELAMRLLNEQKEPEFMMYDVFLMASYGGCLEVIKFIYEHHPQDIGTIVIMRAVRDACFNCHYDVARYLLSLLPEDFDRTRFKDYEYKFTEESLPMFRQIAMGDQEDI